jgi:hypothetical protein
VLTYEEILQHTSTPMLTLHYSDKKMRGNSVFLGQIHFFVFFSRRYGTVHCTVRNSLPTKEKSFKNLHIII